MSTPTIDFSKYEAQSASPQIDFSKYSGSAVQPAPDTGIMASLKRTGGGLIHLPGAIWDAVTKPPQTPEEKAAFDAADKVGQGPQALALMRLVAQPMVQEHLKAQQLRQQAKTQTDEQANNAYSGTNHLANMHDIASVVPILGPMSADIVDRYLRGDKSGAVTDTLTNMAAPKVMEGTGKLAIGAVNKMVGTAPKVAEAMYQSALKPSTTNTPAENLAAVRTGLNSAIPISEEGAIKLNGLVNDLNDKVKAQIASNPDAPINKFQVASRLNKPAADFAKQASPTADLNTIADVGNDFLDTKPGTIRAEDAQAIKQGTYKQIGDRAYGEASTARVEAEKSLARGLKEELENHFPEIKGLNAQESQLFDLKGALEKAVNRAANRQTIPARLGGPLAGVLAGSGVGAAFGHEAGAAAGLGIYAMKTVLDDPMLQSKLAIAISRAGRGTIPPALANAKVQQFVNSLAQSVNGGAQADQQ
jgi:hypothetical protein